MRLRYFGRLEERLGARRSAMMDWMRRFSVTTEFNAEGAI